MSEDNPKPGLNEQTFAKLLEAAYVLQEHNRQLREMEESLELQSEQLRQQEEAETQAALLKSSQRSPQSERPNADYTLTLAQIVEAQHQIQIRHLQSDEAMAVVAERTTRITGASGAGIGILEGKTIRYHAGFGASASPVDSEISLEKAICAICVRTGQVLRTPDVNTEFLFDPELCHPRHIQSLVAVPVYHDGNIVGALELYFDTPKGFAEQDIHTCQLMAGLVTEAIGRKAESALKKSMAAERSSMMAAIEKLRPSLEPLAEEGAPVITGAAPEPEADTFLCWKCGSSLLAEEQFCGKCGAPRISESDRSSLQSKVASAWHTPQADQRLPVLETGPSLLPGETEGPGTPLNATANQENLPELAASLHLKLSGQLLATPRSASGNEEIVAEPSSVGPEAGDQDWSHTSVALTQAQPGDIAWSSAAKARDFLEGTVGNEIAERPGAVLAFAAGRFLLSRRRDLCGRSNPVGCVFEQPGGSNRGKRSFHELDPAQTGRRRQSFHLGQTLDWPGCRRSSGDAGIQGKSRDPGLGRFAHGALLLSGIGVVWEDSEGKVFEPARRAVGSVRISLAKSLRLMAGCATRSWVAQKFDNLVLRECTRPLAFLPENTSSWRNRTNNPRFRLYPRQS